MFRYVPNPALASVALIGLGALADRALLGPSRAAAVIARILNRRVVTVTLLLAVIAATFWIYPLADARRERGLGSTADDALIVPMRMLIAGRPLYSGELMGGVATSPGPGWIILNAPFTLGRAYFLLTPFYVSLLWTAIRSRNRSLFQANLMLVLLLSSMAFWELTVTGHDVVATSCAIGALLLWTERAFERGSSGRTLALAVGWGTLATARIVYPFLIPLTGALLWRRDRRLAQVLVVVGLGVTLAWHVPFALTNRPYDPFHLFGRAEESMGGGLLAAGGIATAAVSLLALRRATTSRASLYGWFVLCFTTPLLFVALGELLTARGRLVSWEGANYLIPPLGAFLAWVCTEARPTEAS